MHIAAPDPSSHQRDESIRGLNFSLMTGTPYMDWILMSVCPNRRADGPVPLCAVRVSVHGRPPVAVTHPDEPEPASKTVLTNS